MRVHRLVAPTALTQHFTLLLRLCLDSRSQPPSWSMCRVLCHRFTCAALPVQLLWLSLLCDHFSNSGANILQAENSPDQVAVCVAQNAIKLAHDLRSCCN